MGKEYAKAGKFLNLASRTERVLSDPTIKDFRSKREKSNTELVATCVNGVRDILDKTDQAKNCDFSWADQLENFDVCKRLWEAANIDSAVGVNDDSESGNGQTQFFSVLIVQRYIEFGTW